MLLRHRSGEPSPDQLAVNNQQATLDKYRREIGDAVKHWQSEQARAAKTGSAALKSMSGTILGELSKRGDWVRAGRHLEVPQNRIDMENARRRVLSALAVSMLLRAEGEGLPAAVPNFVGSQGELGTILDVVVDERVNPEKRSESRVHMPIVVDSALPAGASEQWYTQGDLWVRQVCPAEPTDYLVNTFLPRMKIEPDFTHFETVYPYVAAK
jgi:hypothetical protein